ncbi:Starch binding domain-containing protein [Pseudomonas sp. ok272]|uniref:carbohydrate-binding module family 20 domain-containing protein n=1 Tax=unclassified Pseudomonas TaxID=196821 RepID=UPI0008BA45BF|nr:MULTISPECIES: carbohydrate-binding module family 20 domain-containing protein [unclassified Pseudomonas]SEM44625.1 Starch binding domain-containing protein [Pseudomonas sp. ok272]SFM16483.1 Starch binding domain-containing protein [Pseudomonas sp. ok602]
MTRVRYFLSLGALLLAMLSVPSQAQDVQLTYLLNVSFRCENGVTTQGYSVYVVGARAELGDWDPAKAVRLTPSAYPTWTGQVRFIDVNPGVVVEWKCIVRSESNPSDVKWQPDPNNKVTMAFTPEPVATGRF